jgi:two-component system, cell cycle response regulator DivK
MAQKTILSAEDNTANRKIIRDLFGKHGYMILEAVNGEEVIEMAKTAKPDIILMDIQLPKISGYEATETIKSNPDLKHIPIIAVTSYALSGDEQKAHEAGCDDYITKPFCPSALLAKVEEYLQGNGTSAY